MLRRLQARGTGGQVTASEPSAATHNLSRECGSNFVPDYVRGLFDGVADGLVISDPAGNLVDWNPAALRLHGFGSLDEVRHHLAHFQDIFEMTARGGTSPLPLSQWPIARAMRHEPVHNFECAVRRLDTKQSWIISYDAVWIQSELEGRACELIVLTLRDMTAHRRAEEAKDQAQRQLLQLLESLPQLVWTCRGDGTCDYLSPQWVAYTGVPAAQQLEFGWLDSVHPDDRDATIRDWNAVNVDGRDLDNEFRIRRADGEYRWFKTRAVAVRAASGAVIRWLGTNTDIHDQRLAAEAQAKLASIVEHTDDAIFAMTTDGVITSWNHSAERLFGYQAAEAIGREITFLLPADRVDEERVILDDVRCGRGVDHVDSRYITKNGRTIDVAITVSPLLDTAGKVVGISQIARDVTSEKSAADALRQSEARFRRLADAMPQIVFSRGEDNTVTYLNQRWIEFTGLQGASSDDVTSIVHPEDLAPMLELRDKATREKRAYTVEFRMRHVAGGPYRWFLARSVPILDPSGKVIEWFGTSTDIEDLKRAEAGARENEARLRGVLDSAVEGIVTIDDHGLIETVNAAVVKTFGYAPEEMIGQNVRMLMPSPYSEGHDRYLDNYLKTAQRKIIGIGREVVGRRKDGTMFPVDLSVSEVYVGGRRIFTGIVRDITARKTAEDAARVGQSEIAHLERVRSLGQMASGLAHELNQPLGAIANYSMACRTLLSMGDEKRERVIEALHDIQAEALRAGEIIHRLRGFVKKQHPKVGPADANDIVADTLRLMAFDLRGAGIKSFLALGGDLPPVTADRVQIGQVLVNLIRNALDAMQSMPLAERGLSITTARNTKDFVSISISDRGCGASAEALPKIFDAFYTTKASGLGIGLALSRTIVSDHGGQLTAANNPSGGMTFTMTLRSAG